MPIQVSLTPPPIYMWDVWQHLEGLPWSTLWILLNYNMFVSTILFPLIISFDCVLKVLSIFFNDLGFIYSSTLKYSRFIDVMIFPHWMWVHFVFFLTYFFCIIYSSQTLRICSIIFWGCIFTLNDVCIWCVNQLSYMKFVSDMSTN